jgi:hypothetical protein
VLIDDTGQCVIDPEGANVVPSQTNIWYGSTPRPPSQSTNKTNFLSGGRYRYIEKRMHPGEDLYAIGFYQTVGGANSEVNVSTEVVALLKEWKEDSEQLLKKFDHNKDGQIDMHEWELVRKTAFDEVMKQHQEFKSTPPVNLLGRTHDSRRPYILSAVPQDNLIKRYKLLSFSLIGLFFLAGIFATWMINLRFSGG